ncbi:MAG: phosphatidylinositol-specific phospholipase C domain-containing protein [Candidatus Electrothrix sp. MAN1_4]|nr:phosphatidylinositol-specific phospholipase C domain-containing protein [Candidatus Electrothrix sp. MAN1_4]
MHNWMAQLNENKLVTEVNLPGTHDSGTFAEATFWSIGVEQGRCQTMSFKEQLEAGVRFFDIRLEKQDDDYRFCHGGYISYDLMFHNVLEVFLNFLRKNPTEFIVMSVKCDNGEDFTQEWEAKYGRTPEFYNDKHFPTVENARGKIIILSRLRDASVGFPVRWSDNTKFQEVDETTYLYAVQDYYDVDLEQAYKKKRVIDHYLERAQQMQRERLRICFTSMTGKYYGIPDPKGAAKKINVHVIDVLERIPRGNTYGIIIMDFPSENLIEEIVRSNRE